jgi:maleate isomerase
MMDTTNASPSLSEFVQPRLDGGPGGRGRIGLIALVHDLALEPEFAQFSRFDGVAVYTNRIEMDFDTTPATLRAMHPRIGAVTQGLACVGELDVVCFGCTSGSMAIGPDRIAQAVNQVLPKAKVTTPVTAALTALEALSCRRIGLITPYSDDLNAVVADYLENRGLEIIRFRSFHMRDGLEMGQIDPQCLLDAAGPMADADIDALFCSCTALHVSPVLSQLEDLVGKPVVASNQAMAWHALRLAGIEDDLPNVGSYLSVLQAPAAHAEAAE